MTLAETIKEKLRTAFVDMLIVPCAVSAFDYWHRSAKKKMPEFIKQVVSLSESIQVGAVTREEIVQTFEEISRMQLEATWLKIKRRESEGVTFLDV
jgi:hypothetical protein